MSNQSYFYRFLEPISKELANLTRELENSIFTSPRIVLTHARVFVENILQQVIKAENLPDQQWTGLKERLDLLNDNGYLTTEIRDALHYVRRMGNQASYDSRQFRYSEALLSREETYKIVKWYVEVYGPVDFTVPEYKNPTPYTDSAFDSSELETRLKALEELLKTKFNPQEEQPIPDEDAATTVGASIISAQPGCTTIRTLTYKGEQLEIPHFLRDAFLLPPCRRRNMISTSRFLLKLHQKRTPNYD